MASLDLVEGRQLIVSSGKDCNVMVWTLRGSLLGVFGEHSWDLDDPTTWQERDEDEGEAGPPEARRPPLGDKDGLYMRVSHIGVGGGELLHAGLVVLQDSGLDAVNAWSAGKLRKQGVFH